MNSGLTDAEFIERLEVLKKVESFLENGMADEMLGSRYPTAMIFYMKNAFKWQNDVQQDIKIGFQFGGFAAQDKPKEKKEKKEKDEK